MVKQVGPYQIVYLGISKIQVTGDFVRAVRPGAARGGGEMGKVKH